MVLLGRNDGRAEHVPLWFRIRKANDAMNRPIRRRGPYRGRASRDLRAPGSTVRHRKWGAAAARSATAPIGEGLSRPSGPTILGQRAPRYPWAASCRRAAGRIEWYQPRLFSSKGEPVPHGEMRRVPPVHLQVKLAVPAVARSAPFPAAAWIRALDRGQVLGQHDAPFQLRARGSRLPDSSIAPPLDQNRSQCFSHSEKADRASGKDVFGKDAAKMPQRTPAARFAGDRGQLMIGARR